MKKNNKGFTLIELLAVIVILAVVLGIAIPAVSQYITKSKKNGYKANLIQFIDAARKNAALGDEYSYPEDHLHGTVIAFNELRIALEKGGNESPYGNLWRTEGSFVVIVNTGNADSPEYNYFITASDGSYVVGDNKESVKSPKIYNENYLKAENVVRAQSDGIPIPSLGDKFCINNDLSELTQNIETCDNIVEIIDVER